MWIVFFFLCSSALREDRLTLVQNGSSSPCLDLRWVDSINAANIPFKNKNWRRPHDSKVIISKLIPLWFLSRLDKVLAMLVRERQTDLVIIEGMGRAIHTNYYAMLSCESLKMAVIKNSWLADRLGGKLFSVVFKYEVPAGKSH